MPTIVELLAHPERRRPSPPPPRTDLVRIVLGGVALWALGLILSAALALAGVWSWTPAAICGAGIVLGVPALLWSRRHQ